MRISTKELLQKAITGVVKQGRQSVNESGTCMYRSDVGCCAVGHLITDEYYSTSLEVKTANHEKVRAAVEGSIGRTLTPKEMTYLDALQTHHDLALTRGDFLSDFKYKVLNDDRLPKYCKEFFKGVA